MGLALPMRHVDRESSKVCCGECRFSAELFAHNLHQRNGQHPEHGNHPQDEPRQLMQLVIEGRSRTFIALRRRRSGSYRLIEGDNGFAYGIAKNMSACRCRGRCSYAERAGDPK